jgi:hypothetical protein
MAVRERVKVPPLVAPQSVTITVGIHGDEGADSHLGGTSFADDGALESSSALTVAQVASFHEFGVPPYQLRSGAVRPGIPQRSFIRGWFDESQDFIRETLRSQMTQVVAGKLPVEKAMARIALAFEGAVKQRIAKGIAPALSPVTIALKGSSKPLIDKGQLRAAVRGKATLTTRES